MTRSATGVGPPTLRGRTPECALVDGLIADIRQSESRSLVVHGEAGIGKTALLEYLIASTPDLTVLRAAGVESEMELAYRACISCAGRSSIDSERLPPRSGLRWRSFSACARAGAGPVSRRVGAAEHVVGGLGGASGAMCR